MESFMHKDYIIILNNHFLYIIDRWTLQIFMGSS